MVAKKSTKKPARKTRPGKASASGKASTTAGVFVFANPKPSPDDYGNFSKADVFADSNVTATTALQPLPKSWRQPEVLDLAQVLSANEIQQIQAAKSIVFHTVGDSGGIKEPSKQFAVADALANDLQGKTYQNGLPAFFYHLGDVVYYLGQERYYYDQYYDPYRNYDAPIFAIPGNHDGMVSPSLPQKTLEGFVQNFCTQTPGHNPEAQGFARTTMTQPGVYFTLNAPFVKFIGLYSNISEGATEGVISGGVVGTAQLTFLQQQLKAAAQERSSGNRRALIIAVHHPPFTGSQDHAPSPSMLTDIDNACQQAKILPDLVISGHAHLYERYTRFMGTTQIPFLVAGTGGYFNLSGFKRTNAGALPKLPFIGTDAKGNKLRLDAFNENSFGFLRMTVSATSIQGEFIAVDVNTKAVTKIDNFTLDLNRHIVS
ncbi:MAG: metallophosphoesterase family protein [Candidatus Sulfotelmatobacter sp.]